MADMTSSPPPQGNTGGQFSASDSESVTSESVSGDGSGHEEDEGDTTRERLEECAVFQSSYYALDSRRRKELDAEVLRAHGVSASSAALFDDVRIRDSEIPPGSEEDLPTTFFEEVDALKLFAIEPFIEGKEGLSSLPKQRM